MPSLHRAFFPAATLLVASAAAFSQPPVPMPAQPGRITIDVVAEDKLGHPVRGLQEQDFTLLDNSQPQKIVEFEAIDPAAQPHATEVLIVIDMINSGFDTVAREREQLGEYLNQDAAKLSYPTTLAIMTENGVKIMQGYTTDGHALLDGFQKFKTDLRAINGSAGFYGAAERLEWSLSQIAQVSAYEATRPGRKLVLMLSPGWPMLAGAAPQQTMKQRQWVFNSIVHLSTGLREAGVTLYCLDPHDLGRNDPFYYQSYLKGVKRPDQAEYPYMALQVLAEHSGGRTLITGRDIKGEIEAAMRDTGPYYKITFDEAAADHPNEYHELKVKTSRPDLAVRAPSLYYANVQVIGGKPAAPSQSAEPMGAREPR